VKAKWRTFYFTHPEASWKLTFNRLVEPINSAKITVISLVCAAIMWCKYSLDGWLKTGKKTTETFYFHFYARKQLLLSARLSHRNSVRLSVRPSVTQVNQSKTAQARITKSSLSAAWKTLVSGTVKLFHKFEGGHPERGR